MFPGIDHRGVVGFFTFAALVMGLAGCQRPDVSVNEAKLMILRDSPGTGREARPGDIVKISYSATLPDGEDLLRDSNFQFEVGSGSVIRGINEAVTGMRVGGERVIECPPRKHWGRHGYGDAAVPSNTTLTITIALMRVRNARR